MLGRRRGSSRGDALLLAHLAALDRLTLGGGTSARARLEAKLGPDTARLVLGTLGSLTGASRKPAAT
jgi:hypothetical protein